MSNNSYTKEFKIKAVELLEQSNKSVRQVAKELGVAENNLYNWRKQLLLPLYILYYNYISLLINIRTVLQLSSILISYFYS